MAKEDPSSLAKVPAKSILLHAAATCTKYSRIFAKKDASQYSKFFKVKNLVDHQIALKD